MLQDLSLAREISLKKEKWGNQGWFKKQRCYQQKNVKAREGTALWDFHSIRAEEKNWLFAEEKADICRLGIRSLPAWTGGGSREELVRGAIQKPPKTQKKLCLFGAGNKTFSWASREQSRSF